MTIRQRLNTTLLLLLLLLLAGFGLALWIAQARVRAEQRGSQLAGVQIEIQNDLLHLDEILRGLLLDPKSDRQRTQRREFTGAEEYLASDLEALPAAFDEVPELLRSMDNLRGFTQQTLLPFYHRILDAADPAGAAADYEKNEAAIHEHQESLLTDLKRQVDRVRVTEAGSAQGAFFAGMCGLAFVLAASALVAWFQSATVAGDLIELVGQVRQSGSQVDSNATRIATTTHQQESAADEIAATTAQIGAASKQLFATSQELVGTLNEANRAAEQTVSLAGNGRPALDRVETALQQILDASASLAAKLSSLNEKTSNINTVATTITKVADQTNLLSLNAAIEAEKAGEYGLGFAVVAMEIRRLADQTAVAAYDLEKIVKEMHSAVAAGVAGMDRFTDEVRRGGGEIRQVGVHLAHLNQQAQTLTPRFQTVHQGVQAQATGARQISETLAHLNEAASQTAESIRQSQDALEQLNGAARGLQTSVARFKLGNHS